MFPTAHGVVSQGRRAGGGGGGEERDDVVFVGNSTPQSAFSAAPSVPTPGNTVDGDVMIASVSWRGTGTLAWAAGWTELFRDTAVLAGSETYGMAIAYKVANTEGANIAPCTFSASVGHITHARSYRNVDASEPVEAQSFSEFSNVPTSTPFSTGSVATASPDAAVDVTIFTDAAGTGIGATAPSGFTQLMNQARSTYMRGVAAYKILDSTTPTGAITATINTTTSGMILALVLQGAPT